MRKELRWFFGFFVLPMVILIGIDLAFSSSPLPLWRRVTSLEDTCSYGICFIAPAILYLLVSAIRLSVVAFRRGSKAEPETPTPLQSVLPTGLRQGFVTAATFLFGFAMTFLKVWTFGPGAWTKFDFIEGIPLCAGAMLLLCALFRALDIADENRQHYATTRKLLIAGTLLVLAGMIVSVFTPEPPRIR